MTIRCDNGCKQPVNKIKTMTMSHRKIRQSPSDVTMKIIQSSGDVTKFYILHCHIAWTQPNFPMSIVKCHIGRVSQLMLLSSKANLSPEYVHFFDRMLSTLKTKLINRGQKDQSALYIEK